MGTTSTSGWAVSWSMLGLIVLGTAGTGGGLLSWLGGGAFLVIAAVTFRAARVKEGA